MTISELTPPTKGSRIQRNDSKLVTLDIERLPGRAKVKHRGLTIEGDFWDLNSWKHTIGRRIHADDVLEWPRTICAAWKWYDKRKVEFAAEWEDGGPDRMHQLLWDVCNEAAIVCGHNSDRFDLPKIRSAWWLLGLPEPSTFKTVDTLKIARAALGEESNTLDALCKRAGIVSKVDKYDVSVARAACDGHVPSQRRIKRYNIGDPVATEALLDSLRGRIPNHPHIGLLDESSDRCNQCGSGNLERNGTHLAVQIRYVAYRCLDCGANLRGGRHSRAAEVRGAR